MTKKIHVQFRDAWRTEEFPHQSSKVERDCLWINFRTGDSETQFLIPLDQIRKVTLDP